MTEKRFTTKSQDDYFGVIDNNVGDNVCVVNGIHTLIEAEWLCEVLNSLINENEQLKKDLKIIEEHRKQETEYTARLEEKNEQLKSELRNLRRLTNQLYMEGSE